MCCKNPHKKSKTNIIGLAATVHNVLSSLCDVGDIVVGNASRHRGSTKVRLPGRWPNRQIIVHVSEPDYGHRQVSAQALRPGAIRRILNRELEARGIPVFLEG